MAREWTRLSKRVSSWRQKQSDSADKLENIADDHLAVLHRTMREDPAAFGLYEAACAAGERLTTTVDIRQRVPEGEDFAVRFTAAVGGEGGTVADAAIRRAAAKSATTLLQRHPEVAAGGGRLSGDLFCLLYQLFFADVVGEFLHTVVAEKIKLAAPILPTVDPEDRIADWVAKKVVGWLPNPCEEAARIKEAAEKAETGIATVEDPAAALPEIARWLVPRAVKRALGLITADDDEPGGAAFPPLFDGGGTAA